jgi:hypothetical protein
MIRRCDRKPFPDRNCLPARFTLLNIAIFTEAVRENPPFLMANG